ncbi:hypothetical protein [Variovorax rhizosphaerae]|uniref:Uncharacterized protein n=1 Tax=Variovorax rhizosphaerae TaxID=1836200 RepID=A0ABU8WRT4_9BURK
MKLSPGEQPRKQPISFLRVALATFVALVVVVLLLPQKAKIEEYRLYFTQDRKPATFAFTELSEDWTEKTLQEKFAGFPITCSPYSGPLPVQRACGVDVASHNGVPALFVSFFFSGGRLHQAIVNVPWWSRGTAQDRLVATLGQPAASQFFPHAGVRLHGWKLPGGAAVFLNRDRPWNPLDWNGIYWSSPSACAATGCIRSGERPAVAPST